MTALIKAGWACRDGRWAATAATANTGLGCGMGADMGWGNAECCLDGCSMRLDILDMQKTVHWQLGATSPL